MPVASVELPLVLKNDAGGLLVCYGQSNEDILSQSPFDGDGNIHSGSDDEVLVYEATSEGNLGEIYKGNVVRG